MYNVSQFKVSPALQHKNSVPIPSQSFKLGLIITALISGWVNNAMILYNGTEAMPESVVNYCSSVLSILSASMHTIGQNDHFKSD
jgi:hypothetical protein